VEILEGCATVLCGGIGQGAADALAAHGIEPIVAAAKHTIDEAVSLYLSGQLVTTTGRVCLCH
jgi:predicted Fe-Mo cluster-binding NifX family protein